MYNYSIVKTVFANANILQLIQDKRPLKEIKDFDINELQEIYIQSEINKLASLKNNNEFIEAIRNTYILRKMDINGIIVNTAAAEGKGSTIVTYCVNKEELTNDFFAKYITDTLNNAEYFAMAFIHNIADESVIFQSIYPTYLEMCFVLYFYIARNSDPATAKLYSNVAELYNVWRKKETKQKEEIKNHTRKASFNRGTVVEKENNRKNFLTNRRI